MKHSESELQTFAVRLHKLETQNRRWKLAALGLGLSTLSFVLVAAKSADQTYPAVIHARTVEAREFVLKDEDGQIRARLTLNPKPNVSKNAVLLRAEGPALQFYDDKGVAIWTEPGVPRTIPAH
jgi:hypothetical protein